MANAVPVLCVARNVACNVRGGFFRLVDIVIVMQSVHSDDTILTALIFFSVLMEKGSLMIIY
jgi:hypothetical protein